MKKVILILLLAAGIGLNVSAQVQKGAMLVGGMVGFSHSNRDSDSFSDDQITGNQSYKSSNFNITPRFGYFVGNTFELGIGAGYIFKKEELSGVNDNSSYYSLESKMRIFKINPYLSKYFKISENFYITGTFNMIAGFGKENRKNISSNTPDERKEDYKLFEMDINITPGITYFINKNWALSGNIGQIYYKWSKKDLLDTDMEDKPKNTYSGFGINMSFNTFAVGIQYYLNN